METINFTKRQVREALTSLEWARDEVNRSNLDREVLWVFSRIKFNEKTTNYFYVHKIKNTSYRFDIVLDECDKEVRGHVLEDYVYINDEKVEMDKLKEIISDDIVDVETYLQTIDLRPLELYLSKLCRTKVELYSEIESGGLKVISNELVESSGCCIPMFKSLKIMFRMDLTIDAESGEQFVSVSGISYDYEHSHGGHNGYTFARVKYNKNNKEWLVFNYETKQYEKVS